jgi:hypothetical protein
MFTMLEIAFEAFKTLNHEKVAGELKYFFNCQTCSDTIKWLGVSPNDKIVNDFYWTVSLNGCIDYTGDRAACENLLSKFEGLFS